jgi:Protein of unknown function (DUF1674)
MLITHQWGTQALLSTPASRRPSAISSGMVIVPRFLAKFNSVTPNNEDPKDPAPPPAASPASSAPPAREVGGRDGPEPTRFGDWELRGRCIDF